MNTLEELKAIHEDCVGLQGSGIGEDLEGLYLALGNRLAPIIAELEPSPGQAEATPSQQAALTIVGQVDACFRGRLGKSPELYELFEERLTDLRTFIQQAGVPEGYALVPVEPTPEMREAGMDVLMNQSDIYTHGDDQVFVETVAPLDVYRAMTKAAPKPGVTDERR